MLILSRTQPAIAIVVHAASMCNRQCSTAVQEDCQSAEEGCCWCCSCSPAAGVLDVGADLLQLVAQLLQRSVLHICLVGRQDLHCHVLLLQAVVEAAVSRACTL